jgi:cysteine-rich repeat protein
MSKQFVIPLGLVLIGAGSACLDASVTRSEAALTGGIFTTTADGTRVNANIFASKEDVYLDGGPGDRAGPGSAALPEGDYYFQVTDPSGRTLLSSDDLSCRRFHISADGVIDAVYVGSGDCEHVTGLDHDQAALGAITIQLMPFDDTPNPGGEYKVWVTAVGDYDAGGGGSHGFLPQHSKTDNFKVRGEEPGPFCGDGTVDDGEDCDDGNTDDGDGCSSDCRDEPAGPFCGDGTIDDGEDCDDGNTVDGDGCSSDCMVEGPPPPPPVCGNGVVEPGEECDDGNDDDHDACTNRCTINT